MKPVLRALTSLRPNPFGVTKRYKQQVMEGQLNRMTWRGRRGFSVTIFLAALLAGCATASGSAVIIGSVRSALEDHRLVKVLNMMPADAEEIAILKASSGSGWTEQESADYAIEELKRQAARVGANAIVITGRDTSSQGFMSGDIYAEAQYEVVYATAIWIVSES